LLWILEVAKVINEIKCKNSPTYFIPTIVIKRCVDVFALVLSYAINMSFLSGTFPRIFKIGYVVPLLKKPGSDVNDPSNYRPIRNLMTISKVFEKLALTRLGHTCTVRPTSVPIDPLIDRVTPRRLLHSKSRMISTLTWTTSRAVCCCLLTSQRHSICWTLTYSCQDFTWTSASQALRQHGSVPT